MWYHEHIGAESCPIVDIVADRDRRQHDHAPGRHHHQTAATQTIPGVFAEVAMTGQHGRGGWLPLRHPPVARHSLRIWAIPSATRTPTGLSMKAGTSQVTGADRCRRTLWLLGRVDDVNNVSGHRISTARSSRPCRPRGGRRGGGRRGHRRCRRGDRRIRDPGRPAGHRTNSGKRSASTWRETRPDRLTEGRVPVLTCRRPVPARSCAAPLATSPMAGTGRHHDLADPGVVSAIAEGAADNDED